ncbi:signal peptidase, endoplasmic reticulum-type [Halomicrobium zhouii]|uniref:Signal peptidase, endoplasmic reticulum-type n=1 Tax=Halomicrobium zhouii TaxID=767519 RepID=A0A1I6KPH6_9EURY|nr:signal peptidase I [Halomicrobium zhouii]SFR93116.1 signal peptidase, endoplasmic reticulum-type [Halomicrobium zhouii]
MTDSNPSDSADVDWRRIANLVGLAVLGIVVFLFVAAAVPQVVGVDESYVVLSDSMSPAIDAGAVVFVGEVPANDISEGDVITIERAGGSGDSSRVTHRVVEVVEEDGERRFRTKGDANEDPDPSLVAPSNVIGVVQFHVPYMGYVTSFAQTRLGILALVVVPAVLLVVSEVWDLLSATKDEEDDEDSAPRGEDGS